MENVINRLWESVRFGQIQHFKNIHIVPLLGRDGAFEYRTLGEALGTHDLTITEVSDAGSVPDLLVVNSGTSPVLLIDGEELVGAKQNRVLNTSVLLAGRSQTRIPVSCTEQGRWSHVSPAFAESGNIMAQKARAWKSRSVSQSLYDFASYHSNQGQVWENIAELQAKAGFHSPTSAMRDVFRSRENDLRRCAESFPCLPGQVGLLVFIGELPVGLELMSRGLAYARLHPKLVRSYALESLLQPGNEQAPVPDLEEQSKQFLQRIGASAESSFPSVGCGQEFRYRGDALAGAALLHENEVLHAAWFSLEAPGQPSATQRRSPTAALDSFLRPGSGQVEPFGGAQGRPGSPRRARWGETPSSHGSGQGEP